MPPTPSPTERLTDLLPGLADRAAEGDRTGRPPAASLTGMARAGLLRAPLSSEEGGDGLGEAGNARALFGVLRLLGGANLSLARLYEGHVNAIGLVGRYGTDEAIGALGAAVRDGAWSAVWGADGARPLRAEADGAGGFVLRGEKVLASGAGFVQRPLVTAATPDGPILLLLALGKDARVDTSRWTPSGMRASATGTVTLDGYRAGREAVVGRPGDFLLQPTLSGGAWRFCAVHLGAAERLLDLFRAELTARGRGEDPYQLQRVAACAAAVGSAAFWIEAAAVRLAEGRGNPDDTVAFTNLTRFVTERAALDVIEAVQRGIGLAAFVAPHPVERVTRDLSTYLRQPVPDRAMADAARGVLASPRPTAQLWEIA